MHPPVRHAPSCTSNILWEPVTLYQKTGGECKAITDLKNNHITDGHRPECIPRART